MATTATLTKERRSRGYVRTSVQNAIAELEALLVAIPLDKVKVEAKLQVLQRKHVSMKEYDEKIHSILLELEDVSTEEVDKEFCDSDKYDDLAHDCMFRVKKSLMSVADQTETSASGSTKKQPSATNVKLPKYDLEVFTGDVFKWTQWRENFEITVNSQTMPTQQKFAYLRQSLKGSAAAEIEKIEITCVNYSAVLKALEDRFGQPQVILAAHAQAINSLSKLQSSSDIKALRSFYDSIVVNTRGMKQILDRQFEPLCRNASGGSPSSSASTVSSCVPLSPGAIYNLVASPLLAPQIMERLPSDIAIAWSRSASTGEEYNLDAMVAFLKKECETRERLQLLSVGCSKPLVSSHANPPSSTRGSRNGRSHVPFTGGTLACNSQHEDKPVSSCIFCGQSHFSSRCKEVYSIPQHKIHSIVMRARACLNCLSTTHYKAHCTSKGRCKVCHLQHHTLLHNAGQPPTEERASVAKEGTTNCCSLHHRSDSPIEVSRQLSQGSQPIKNPPQASLSNDAFSPLHLSTQVPHHKNEVSAGNVELQQISAVSTEASAGEAFMQTALVWVTGKGGNHQARVFLDEGSDFSYVRSDFVKRIGSSPVGSVSLRVNLLDEITTLPKVHSVHQLKLTGVTWPNSVVIKAVERDKLMKPLRRQGVRFLLREFPHLQGLDLADSTTETEFPVHILIGLDNLDRIKLREPPLLDPNHWGLSAHKTLFGWVIRGWTSDPYNHSVSESSVMFAHTRTSEEESLQAFWRLESIGINGDPEKIDALEGDQMAVRQLEETIQYKNNRYEVGLPARPQLRSQLRSNQDAAFACFTNLLRRLRNDQSLGQKYVKAIKTFREQEFCELAPDCPGERYLPHHPVLRPDKTTTKCRPVFNGSFLVKGEPISLNDVLLVGPNLCSDIFDLVIRFRTFPIALAADIEKAFLQIAIREEDRDLLRFFWVARDDLECGGVIELRMKVLPFGLGPSPFVLAYVLSHHFGRFSDPDINQVHKNFYVDDLVTGRESVSEAIAFRGRIVECLSLASMNLRGWKSNVVELRDSDAESRVKLLGVTWDQDSDSFLVLAPEVPSNLTMRSVLGFLAKIYDPCGFITPGILKGKELMRRLWQMGLTWDDPLTPELASLFEEWVKILRIYCEYSVPRFAGSLSDVKQLQIHCFTDASFVSFACCIYLRKESEEGVRVSLLASRSRLAPLQRVTVPRIELLGIVIGKRLIQRMMKVLSLPPTIEVFGWSDSKVALSWIQSDPTKFQPFVANRIREVQELSFVQWKHVGGRDNPADQASRGNCPSLKDLKLWQEGPPWLSLSQHAWPVNMSCDLSEEDNKSFWDERRKTVGVVTILAVNNCFIDSSRYSSWTRLIRLTAWIRRFITNCQTAKDERCRESSLSVKELDSSRLLWIRIIQGEIYSEEISALQEQGRVSASSSLFNLRPFLDDQGILRLRSRAGPPASVPTYQDRNLVILPAEHAAVKLLIMFHHQKLGHQGVGTTIFELRKLYWIVHVRVVVKQLLRQCQVCKRFNSVTYQPSPISLPSFRTVKARPFSTSGCDFAGPLHLRDGSAAHICLFTCASIRAVHLELVPNLTTESFLCAFRRFNARRGPVTVLFSDNGKTFRGASSSLIDMGVAPRFIPERAPHWGGWWERLVKSTKHILRRVLGRASLQWEELSTLLVEIERLINNRPISTVSDDHQDIVPISPSDFLFPIPPEEDASQTLQESLTRRLRHRSEIAKILWNQWQGDYLIRLHTWQWTKANASSSPHVDDVVLVDPESSKNRALWPLGRVTSLIMGRDRTARAAYVQLQNGKLIRRPVTKLYPLEVAEEKNKPTDDLPPLPPVVIPEATPNNQEVVEHSGAQRVTKTLSSDDGVFTRSGRRVNPPDRLDL